VIRLIHWAPALIQAVLIITLSNQSNPPGADLGPDYVLHALGYGVLGIAVAWGQTQGLRHQYTLRAAWIGWLLCSVFGISDELHQWFIPGRSTSFSDWLADTVGSGIAIWMTFAALKAYRKWREPGAAP